MHIILKITLHLFFWINYFFLAAALSFNLNEGFDYIIKYIGAFLTNFAWAVLAFYSVYLFAYKLFERKKFTAYFFVVIGVSVVLTILFIHLHQLLFVDIYKVTNHEYYTSLPGTFILANCGALLKGFISWFDTAQKKSELEKSSLMHELESLKSQINPHFLFNTINNIDSLIQTDTHKASESLLKLSDILRYMLYGVDQTEVLLLNEANHLQNIVELQKLRWEDQNAITFNTEGINNEVKVAPLLFSPFIENAFKYAQKDIKEKAVDIRLEYKKRTITFYCKNYYNPNKEKHKNLEGGIGLNNVKRRLELLYPKRHCLTINPENGIFEVNLKLIPLWN